MSYENVLNKLINVDWHPGERLDGELLRSFVQRPHLHQEDPGVRDVEPWGVGVAKILVINGYYILYVIIEFIADGSEKSL